MKYRFENFGGIISSQDPPFLAFVDRDYMRELSLGPSPLWDTADESVGILSAPTEVHFAVTNRCSAGCDHCYMDGGEPDKGELDTRRFKAALDVLARMNVFHIALGGGEALERGDLFEIAEYARQIGLVPNLTVSGYSITQDLADKMKIFGQVNVSFDGVGERYGVHRGKTKGETQFKKAVQAVERLTRAGVPTGINCVVGRENFDYLEEIFIFAKKNKMNEIEFLRLKPSGRGVSLYKEAATTHEQNKKLVPMLAAFSKKHKITAKIDCSFVPMYCYHEPPMELLAAMATYGCEAGNVLLGIRSDGSVGGCSFLDNTGLSVFDLPAEFSRESQNKFAAMRTWVDRAVEPCLSCQYLELCKGGCHGVSLFLTGDYDRPDPGCPIVVEYQQNQKEANQ